MIKEIEIDFLINYFSSTEKGKNSDYNKLNVNIDFRDCRMDLQYSDVIINVDSKNLENDANKIYDEIMNVLNNNEDRYDKTIKHKQLIMQCFTISIGIILSYIIYFILKINMNNLPEVFQTYLNNKYILIFSQWFVAILLGNLISSWYIINLYKPLLPERKYVRYNTSSYQSVYTDDIDEYMAHSEVHFGKFSDAKFRRNKINKIFNVTNKIIIIQLIISILLLIFLK